MTDTRSTDWIAYDFAILRAVPHVHLGAYVPVGVVVHARTAEFLRMRALTDERDLARRIPDVDAEMLARYLRSCEAVCAGDPSHGPIALVPTSERFHWLTAPRSDVIQASPVHGGLSRDPQETMEELYRVYVQPD